MPPPPGGKPPPAPFFSGRSATIASVVMSRPETEAASRRAVRTTFVGSKGRLTEPVSPVRSRYCAVCIIHCIIEQCVRVLAVRIFKAKTVAKFARRERILDASLREAIQRAERGLIDADLGGGLIKQRVARAGQGKSGGYRMMIAYRMGDRAVFLLGFARNERDNVTEDELAALRRTGDGLASCACRGDRDGDRGWRFAGD